MNEEVEIARAFVVAAKQARFIALLANPKRRRRATATLAHFRDWDPRRVVTIPPAEQDPAAILRMLQGKGAGDSCHLISEASGLDGRRLALAAALDSVVGQGMGTVVSCVAGRLAYYEGEDPADRCLLVRSTTDQ